jgi:hypothetical protein
LEEVMKKIFAKFAGISFGVVLALMLSVMTAIAAGPVTGEQVLLGLKYLNSGVQAQGAKVLQTGEINSLSASVATATLTQVIAAPASGSIYIRGVLVEKSTGAAGTYTIQTGTGTNCGTGTAVLLGPVTNPVIGFNRIEIVAPATKAVCIQTDAATTLVRVLSN